MYQQQQRRRRPRISITISGHTLAVIAQVAKDRALPNPGVTIDYIINDWIASKRAANEAVRVPEEVTA
jgi:hypothetical protein